MAKIYVRRFRLLSDDAETNFLMNQHRTCYNTSYPYKIFPEKELEEIEFAPITIFYGGNGSGKTTLLNIIAEKTKIHRHAAFSGSAFFENYVNKCEMDAGRIPVNSEILTSDDVFDYLLDVRNINNGIDLRREELFQEYFDKKADEFIQLQSLADYENWLDSYEARKQTQSKFVRNRLMKNVEMQSNGQSAMKYFVDHITENALYLLDEPENSLSIAYQQELCRFIEDSARFYGCQFIFSTHSPVLLSMKDALIYDLDSVPAETKKWTELENVRRYFEFFEEHRNEFFD